MSDNIIEQIQTKPEFIEKVKKWVVMDSQLKIVNEKTKQYQEPSKNTLISEEPIDEELESIIRDIDKGDLQ